jgi:hypothetical protein
MNQENTSLPNYEDQVGNLTKQLFNYNYIFEVTKCCGYSTFVLVGKKGTLLDIYKAISLHFECPNILSLYVINETTRERKSIPLTDNVRISEYIPKQDRAFFMPIYPIPKPVVFRIYLDDGHFHEHNQDQSQAKVFNAGL